MTAMKPTKSIRTATSGLHGLLTTLLLLFAVQAQAVWVEGVGVAAIERGDLDAARAQARRLALRDAALQYRARIASKETVENGVLKQSSLTVAAQAQAKQIKVLEETRTGNWLRMRLTADLGGSAACGSEAGQQLHKRIAITAFPLRQPQQATLGGLENSSRALANALYQKLSAANFSVMSVTRERPHPDLLDAPTQQTDDSRLNKTLELARSLNVQFVISGVIQDMAVADPGAWETSLWKRVARDTGLANRERRLVLDVFMHDGFSGSPVFEQRFSAAGLWDSTREQQVGFGSEAFWATGYGRAVDQLLEQVKGQVAEALACQPFMARITRVDEKTAHLAAGAIAGLRPGDVFQVFRTMRFQDGAFADMQAASPELEDTVTKLRITQVQPEFSRGSLSRRAGERNIQQGDIAVIW